MSLVRTKTINVSSSKNELHDDESDSLEDDEEDLDEENVHVSRMSDSSNESNE